jgi:hypothetical protein
MHLHLMLIIRRLVLNIHQIQSRGSLPRTAVILHQAPDPILLTAKHTLHLLNPDLIIRSPRSNMHFHKIIRGSVILDEDQVRLGTPVLVYETRVDCPSATVHLYLRARTWWRFPGGRSRNSCSRLRRALLLYCCDHFWS